MPLKSKAQLIAALVPPLDGLLAAQLLDEYESLERRFVLSDWEPAELDGGQFCEILARILNHIDSGHVSLTKDVKDCLAYVVDDDNKRPHHYTPRSDFLHLAKVVGTVYKFRSARGAVHISSTYEPNHMDARLVIECARWCLAETLRIFWTNDREEVASTIREILKFDTPCVGLFGDRTIIQRTDLSVDEEILVLLHHAGEAGLTRAALGQSLFSPASTISDALKRLASAQCRQIVERTPKHFVLGDLGAKRIREQLSQKLRIQDI